MKYFFAGSFNPKGLFYCNNYLTHHPSHGVCGSHSCVRSTCCKREDAYIGNQKHEIPSLFAGGQCIYILE
jgi:hypothetical protein